MEILTLQPNQEDAGTRIDAWLAANLEDVTRSGAQRLLEEGKITKDGKITELNFNTPCILHFDKVAALKIIKVGVCEIGLLFQQTYKIDY